MIGGGKQEEDGASAFGGMSSGIGVTLESSSRDALREPTPSASGRRLRLDGDPPSRFVASRLVGDLLRAGDLLLAGDLLRTGDLLRANSCVRRAKRRPADSPRRVESPHSALGVSADEGVAFGTSRGGSCERRLARRCDWLSDGPSTGLDGPRVGSKLGCSGGRGSAVARPVARRRRSLLLAAAGESPMTSTRGKRACRCYPSFHVAGTPTGAGVGTGAGAGTGTFNIRT